MTTRIRISNEGSTRIIVGSPTSRNVLPAGDSMSVEVGDKHPVVVTELESTLNEMSDLILPEGFKQ